MSAVADIGLPSANNAAVGYFVDQKKGEVNELKQVSFFRNRQNCPPHSLAFTSNK